MNNIEALRCLLDGKKVRRIDWAPIHYLRLHESGVIRNESGTLYPLHVAFSNESIVWELYTEPKKKTKYAPVMYLQGNAYTVSGVLFSCEEDAKAYTAHQFVKWLIGTGMEVEVEE